VSKRAGALLLLVPLFGCPPAARTSRVAVDAGPGPVQLLCEVHGVPGLDAPPAPKSRTGTIPDPVEEPHDPRHHVDPPRVIAVPLSQVSPRCPKRGRLRLIVSLPRRAGTASVSLSLEGRLLSAPIARGPGVPLPGAILLDGLASGAYAPALSIDGEPVAVPVVHVGD
jgi:hypothetical protein